MEDIAQLLLSQQAVLIYEIVIAVILVISIVLISRQRRLRKQIQESAPQLKRSLDDSLANQRRR